MGDETNPVANAEPYRWRAAVSPCRPPGLARVWSPRSLSGQMLLPGVEWGEQSAPVEERTGNEVALPDSGRRDDKRRAKPRPGPACPNCGATEFDEDGDCIRCWEPGVVPVPTRPKTREG